MKTFELHFMVEPKTYIGYDYLVNATKVVKLNLKEHEFTHRILVKMEGAMSEMEIRRIAHDVLRKSIPGIELDPPKVYILSGNQIQADKALVIFQINEIQ